MEPLRTGGTRPDGQIKQDRRHTGHTLEGVCAKPLYEGVKRFLDIVMSAFVLILLMPVFLILALIIVLDSPGASPIFIQSRVGKDGRVFQFYKFRSMVPRAEEALPGLLQYNEIRGGGPAFKLRNDPRITRVGRFIRRTGLDELPQMINVLKGDMSVVGPRPPVPREVEQYTEYQMQRLAVVPGITCYWQIQPYRNELSFDEWMELDLKYIRERSLLVDAKIMLLTIPAMCHMYGI